MPVLAKTLPDPAVNLVPRSRSRSRMRNRNDPIRSPASMTRLRACCVVHVPAGVPGYPEDMHPADLCLHDEQDIKPLEEHSVDGEEAAGQQALRLDEQEPPPGRIQTARRGLVPAGAQDPADRRLTDPVAEPGQLAVHAAVPPPRVL